ncbi:MAG: ATP-NAD kinase [Anaerolinea sp.]|nr:ATP-NAD kinase [Anaerolinea sp.]
MRPTVGILANPASGKDIRRLVASASVFDNREKLSIVRRAILGAVAAGIDDFVYMPDGHGIVASAFADIGEDVRFAALDSPATHSALDTTRVAERMREHGVACVLTLGGDGTNRAFALGWRDAPLVAVSTGTNNVFPKMVEGTIAGAAAGLVASGQVALHEASRQVKVVHVQIDGEKDDLALIDAVLLDEAFVGARAIWNPARLRTIVLARAEPSAVGISAIGGLLHPVPDTADVGLLVEAGGAGDAVIAPIAPGLYSSVPVREVRELALGEVVEFVGPGMLALDGERERRLRPGMVARLAVRRDGPRAVDVPLVMRLAACRGLFRVAQSEATDGD